jgi:long-chain acyl-CoA synthetase
MASQAQALATVGAAGSPFEITTGSDGVRRFKNAPSTLKEFIDLGRGLEKDFVIFEDEVWTFSQMFDAVDGLGTYLVQDFGISKGDRVGIAMRNLPEWIGSFAAIISIGAVVVSLNAWWSEEEIEYAINDSGLRVLVVDEQRLHRVAKPCERAGVKLIVCRSDERPLEVDGAVRWEVAVQHPQPLPERNIQESDDVTILYTSGTTGFPKGAVSTHGAITQAVLSFASISAVESARRGPNGGGVDPLSRESVFILAVPLFHVTGCVPVMLSSFCWHFKLVMMQRWNAERALHLIEKNKVTNFIGVPTQSWDLLENPHFEKVDTSSLFQVAGGGAPAPTSLVKRLGQHFDQYSPTLAYGLTETNAFGPSLSGPEFLEHPSATGFVPTLVLDVEIRNPQGEKVPEGETGEIYISSPTLVRGYWNRPDATADSFRDGWFRTGDIGRIEGELLYIKDRAKDMIIRGGENVYCAEVESAIFDFPGVIDCAVFGVAHERLGEEVAAAVVVKGEPLPTVEDLHAFLEGKIASYKIPSKVTFVREPLLRNAAGKLMKRNYPALFFSR